MRLITCILFLIFSQVCNGQTVELIMDQNPTNNTFAETIYENGVYTASGRYYFPLKTGNDYQICRIGGTDTTVTTINLNEPLDENAPNYIVALNDKVFIFTSENSLIYDETLDSSYNFLEVLPTGHNFWKPFTINEKSIFVDNGKLVILSLPKTGVNAQIWKTDGTSTGTNLFSTVSGLTSSGVYNLSKETTALNTYFFNVVTALFMVDRVTGVSSKADVYAVSSFVELNGMLYFVGNTNSLGSELWKTNGTELGTSLVYEFYPGSMNGLNNEPQRIGSLLYMVASNPTYGNEYWKSDGTTSGTELLKDIVSGSSYQSSQTIIYNNYLYYTHSSTELRAVNIFDTTIVKNYNHGLLGNNPRFFFVSNGTLFFIMPNANPWPVKALYKINSNDVIEWVYNLSTSANPTLGDVKLWNNKFYFSIENKLLLSDGTTTGTHFVRNFNGQVLNYNEIRWSKHIGNEIYMFHYIPHLIDSISFVKLNNSDTIISLVKKLTYFHPNMSNIGFNLYDMPNSLNGFYFKYEIPGVYETSFWKSNGTTIGTKRVLHLIPQGNKDGYFSSFYSWKKKAYFTTVKNIGPQNAINYLHQSDGTSKGTVVMTQKLKSFDLRYAEFNNKLYFTSLDTLYSCNEQPNSVNAVYGFPSQKLYILSTSPKIFLLTNENPKKLYVSDGTALGTVLIYTFNNSQTYNPEFIEFNNQAFFRINGALWKSDGTTGGTVLVKDFSNLGTLNPLVLNGSLLFNGSVAGNSRLMKTDGTTNGTVAVSTFNNYNGSVFCSYQTLFKGKVFFEAVFENSPHRKLYRTDATSAGTMVVSSQPAYGFQYLRAVGDKLFFAGTDYLVSPELWAYNSTNGITQKVLETIPGSSTALTNEFISVGSYLYYVNYHKQFGYELWRTDTNYNSKMIYDLLPGNYSSKPKNLFKVSDSLFFFTAYSPQYGYELYAMKTNKTGVKIIANEEDCPTSTVTFTSSFFGKNPITQYQWTINDTLVSTTTQMQHIFRKYGPYVIKLITKNTASVIDTTEYTYVNGKNFRVALDVNDSIQCLSNNLFVFSDSSKVLSTTIGNRIWNMGDGTFYYNDTVVQHNYKTKGIYNVTLKIIGANSCTDSTVMTVRVNDDSVSSIQGSNLIQTNKITIHSVQKISGYQYHWTLNPMFGSIVSDPDSSTVQIQWLNNSGSTLLKVAIVNTLGCTRLIEDTIQLVSLKAAFSVNDQSQCLPGNLFIFNDISSVSGISNIERTWRLGDGISYSDSSSIQYSYSSIGAYQVWLIVKGPYDIADSVMHVIYINNNNSINVISGKDSVLISTSETYSILHTSGNNYLWYLTNNLGVITSGSITNSIIVQWGPNSGVDTLKVFVEDSNSCSVTINYPIRLYSITGLQYSYTQGPLIYPNPVKDKLTFSQLQSDDWNLSIYSSIGSIVTQTTIKGMSGDVDVTVFPSGIYFYVIGNSQKTYSGKFVKE